MSTTQTKTVLPNNLTAEGNAEEIADLSGANDNNIKTSSSITKAGMAAFLHGTIDARRRLIDGLVETRKYNLAAGSEQDVRLHTEQILNEQCVIAALEGVISNLPYLLSDGSVAYTTEWGR